MTPKALRARSPRAALAVGSAIAVASMALSTPSFATDQADIEQHLYNLKMEANSACRRAREYKDQMQSAWQRINDDPRARDDYDLAHAMYQSQRQLCLTAKETYAHSKYAQAPSDSGMPEGPPSVDAMTGADSGVPEGPPTTDAMTGADSGVPEGPPSTDAMTGADSGVPEGPPSGDTMSPASAPVVSTNEVSSGACMVICDDVGFCQGQDYDRTTGVCTIAMNPADPGFDRVKQACPRVPPEQWIISYVGERWQIGCPPGSTGPIPPAPPPSQEPADDLGNVE